MSAVAQEAVQQRVNATTLRDEARLVGLREFHTPTLEAVERRRTQLWVISLIGLLGVASVMTVATFLPSLGVNGDFVSSRNLRLAMFALTIAFAAYVVEKERHLRRLTRLLVDERVLTAALSNRLQEVSTLLEAGKAINSVLELEAVLEIILRSATSLLDAQSGSIMLLENEDHLRAVCVHGNEAARDALMPIDQGISGRVARSKDPLLVSGRIGGRNTAVDSAMCVPLIYRDDLLGVLNVNGAVDRAYTEYDLRALSLFAEQAANAIGNARLYEAERLHVAELVELERHKSEFLAAVSHDLRTPLTSLVGCARTLQKAELDGSHRIELAQMIDRQATRLGSMIEDLLTAARLEAEEPAPVEPVDLAALVEEVVRDYGAMGSEVSVLCAAGTLVLALPGALHRALVNLLDNAFKHGAPPVEIKVEERADVGEVVLSVVDHGPGIPAPDRTRVFERFFRLDSSRNKTGMGLGLPIVQGLVSACGGSVVADETPGGGTAVRVTLRRA